MSLDIDKTNARRTLYFYGLCGLFTMLIVIGCMNWVDGKSGAYATGNFLN
jgi:hypothetical protein